MFGRLGDLDPGLESDEDPDRPEEPVSAEEEEKKRIRKGQATRATARSITENSEEVQAEDTFMPAKKDTSVSAAGTPRETRRTSVGRAGALAKEAAAGGKSSESPGTTRISKRKNSLEAELIKRPKVFFFCWPTATSSIP